MAILFPIGFYNPPQLKEGESGISKFFKDELQYIIAFLYVNPESISFSRDTKIATGRTFGGTIAQPWETDWDVLTFSGKFFGYRSWIELYNFMEATKQGARNKKIALIYKYLKFWGYIKDLKINSDPDYPLCYNYTLTFISQDSFELYRLMIGVTPRLEFDDIAIRNQWENLKERTKDPHSTTELFLQIASSIFIFDKSKTFQQYNLSEAAKILLASEGRLWLLSKITTAIRKWARK
jgi:hypothetical protein